VTFAWQLRACLLAGLAAPGARVTTIALDLGYSTPERSPRCSTACPCCPRPPSATGATTARTNLRRRRTRRMQYRRDACLLRRRNNVRTRRRWTVPHDSAAPRQAYQYNRQHQHQAECSFSIGQWPLPRRHHRRSMPRRRPGPAIHVFSAGSKDAVNALPLPPQPHITASESQSCCSAPPRSRQEPLASHTWCWTAPATKSRHGRIQPGPTQSTGAQRSGACRGFLNRCDAVRLAGKCGNPLPTRKHSGVIAMTIV
jgi:hypothetical protein